MTAKTYSLAEVAVAYLPSEWVGAERWLRDRLNRGEIPGYRLGRVWRMTEDDVADFIARRRSPVAAAVQQAAPAASIVDGLSERSRRRLREVS